uniref:Uncharacterized protein n=1 Tax=Oryza brachyantha TaxID=4533 RepID=J3N1S3_ORYBR
MKKERGAGACFVDGQCTCSQAWRPFSWALYEFDDGVGRSIASTHQRDLFFLSCFHAKSTEDDSGARHGEAGGAVGDGGARRGTEAAVSGGNMAGGMGMEVLAGGGRSSGARQVPGAQPV